MRHQDRRITTEVYGHLASGYLNNEMDRLRFEPAPADWAVTVIPISAAASASGPESAEQPVTCRRLAMWSRRPPACTPLRLRFPPGFYPSTGSVTDPQRDPSESQRSVAE